MIKKQKKFIASLALVSLVIAMVGYTRVNSVQAIDSLKDAKVLISDSDYSVDANTIFTFTRATSTEVGGYFDIVFPGDFGTFVLGDITCPANYDPTSIGGGRTARCTRNTSIDTSTSTSVTVAGVTNPASGTGKVFNISHNNVGNDVLERVQVMVVLIDDVWMTARVDATLQFTVAGTSTGAVVNGVTCTATTTATSTPFGTLVPSASSTVCQELRVTTNASRGFTVTVEQDTEMTSDGGDNINSFVDAADGSGTIVSAPWIAPAGTLDDDKTYGHMGLTSDDTDLASLGLYENLYTGAGTPEYVGLNGTAPRQVYHHDGPADGSTNGTQDKGRVMVAYTAEVNALQQAGDYENTLTYIATPTY